MTAGPIANTKDYGWCCIQGQGHQHHVREVGHQTHTKHSTHKLTCACICHALQQHRHVDRGSWANSCERTPATTSINAA
jgi:hypothetical protein